MNTYRIIVSLTSYPKRIKTVSLVIRTLLIQTRRPDRILLWLSEEEFPEKNLPEELLELRGYGLEIRWVADDLKSHKKYYYALREFPNDLVITVDDDMYYHPELVETLYGSFLRHPESISCTLVNLIGTEKGKLLPYGRWKKDYASVEDREMMDLLPVGAGGVLYPPGCICLERLCDVDSIKRYCPCQDDIWLKVNEALDLVPAVLVKDSTKFRLLPISGTQDSGLFQGINRTGNDTALEGLSEYLSGYGLTMYELLYSSPNTVERYVNMRKNEIHAFVDAIVSEQAVYLYGAGEGAKSTYGYLKQWGLEGYVKGFLVTKGQGNPKELLELPVTPIDEFDHDQCVILITTAERIQGEIIADLRQRGYKRIAAMKDSIIIQHNDLVIRREQLEQDFILSFQVISV